MIILVTIIALTSNALVYFAGGYNGVAVSSAVDIYYALSGDYFQTKSLALPRSNMATTTTFFMFFVGGSASAVPSDQVEMWKNQYVDASKMSEARYGLAGVAVGNISFFAGGTSSSGKSSAVDIITSYQYDIVTPTTTTTTGTSEGTSSTTGDAVSSRKHNYTVANLQANQAAHWALAPYQEL